MALSELTDPDAVEAALEEYDRLGQPAFLEKYGYAPARRYQLKHDGKTYDSKAIVGAAFGYQFPNRGPLSSSEFTGGDATVRPLLEGLGFVVSVEPATSGDTALLTGADLALIASSRTKAKYADLSDEERAAYQRAHESLRKLGEIAQAELGRENYKLVLTSGFHPNSGVRGYLPKDLWFAVCNIRNEKKFVGMPQLFMIVSARGIEYGFAACIPPRQFSDAGVQARVLEAAPALFDAFPAPGSTLALKLQQRLEESGHWHLRKQPRGEPLVNDFTTLDEWLSFLRSPQGHAAPGGAISRYLSHEDVDAIDLASDAREAATMFSDLMDDVIPGRPPAHGSSVQGGLEKLLSSYVEQRESVPFGQHDEMKKDLKQLRAAIENLPALQRHPHVKVSYSVGSGSWSKIPWIALVDERETDSTQRGRYCAFLFNEDMSGVNLALTQGVWDLIQEHGRPRGMQLLHERAERIRALVQDGMSSRFQLDDEMNLCTGGVRGQGYEGGTIAYRLYKRGEVPDDASINDDLSVLLDSYAEVLDQAEQDTGEVGAWIFQANPKIFDLDGALAELSQLTWTVKRENPAVGDRVFLWRAGREAGVVALGTVIEPPDTREQLPEEEVFAANKEQFAGARRNVILRVDQVLPEPLLKGAIAADPRLQDMTILRFANAGVFKVPPHHAEALDQLIADLSVADHGDRAWIYAPGADAVHWDEFFEAGLMAIGWDHLGDLNQFGSTDDVLAALERSSASESRPSNAAKTCYDFAHSIRVGDRIFAKRGAREIIGYGVVTGGYEYLSDRPYFKHVRAVHWERKDSWASPSQLPLKALTEVTPERSAELERLVAGGKPRPPAPRDPYTIEDGLEGLFMQEQEFRRILSAWSAKKNLILQGPPGVGKSFIARRLAYALMGFRDPGRIRTVQFHQSYSYEDFIQGYRPTEQGFALRKGVFLDFCERALAEPEETFVFVVDEINRGNLSKILGELMLLIEPDKRAPEWGVKLTYALSADERFYVPPNLYLLGMMNTADRSLSLVDYALRRRFGFISLQPQFHSIQFREFLRDKGASAEIIDRIITRLEDLNAQIAEDKVRLGPGFRIGHSYFVPRESNMPIGDDWYRGVIECEIAPLLQEYWFDDQKTADNWTESLLEGTR